MPIFESSDNQRVTFPLPISIALGGTGASDVATARANLGLGNFGEGQINFPAVQNPSINPNTLDDYKEGTFTPMVVGTATAGIGTYTVQLGNYTKIGNRVFFEIYIGWSDHSGTGDLTITGLPFVASGTTTFSLHLNGLLLNTNHIGTCFVAANNAIINLRQYTPTGVSVPVPMDASCTTILISGHYRAS